jgi:isopentenyl diphosphate isomerase/L-lactate dehydrogenase-like FMN-dependent dehydrogenase
LSILSAELDTALALLGAISMTELGENDLWPGVPQ